jgi:hypothetical protein
MNGEEKNNCITKSMTQMQEVSLFAWRAEKNLKISTKLPVSNVVKKCQRMKNKI